MEPLIFDADLKLLSRLLGYEPLDCARRPNGDLVYLNPAGQKFILTTAELDKLAQKTRVERSPAQGQGTETPKAGQTQAAGSEKDQKPRSHHKKVIDPASPKQGQQTSH